MHLTQNIVRASLNVSRSSFSSKDSHADIAMAEIVIDDSRRRRWKKAMMRGIVSPRARCRPTAIVSSSNLYAVEVSSLR